MSAFLFSVKDTSSMPQPEPSLTPTITYRPLNAIAPSDLLALMNDSDIRTHLIEHPLFDLTSLAQWVDDKVQVDAQPHCRVVAIFIADQLAGWGGVQPDDDNYEIAIILAKPFWGYGIRIFKDMVDWARTSGLKQIVIHLLNTRKEYRFLKKAATSVTHRQLMGHEFTTYQLALDKLPLFTR